MKKKHKYTLFGIIFVLIATVLTLQIRTYALTQEEIDAYLAEKDKTCNEKNLYEKYNVSMEKTGSNQFRIYLAGADADIEGAEFKVTEVKKGTNYTDLSTLGVIKKGQDVYINVDLVNDFAINDDDVVDPNEKVATIVVAMTTSKDGCLGINDEVYQDKEAKEYKYKGNFYVELEYKQTGQAITGTIQNGSSTEANSNIGDGKACTNFINGIYNESQFNSATNAVIKKTDFESYNYAAVSTEGQNFYRELLPYCFKDQVTTGTNYTETEITGMISDAITAWKLHIVGGSSSTPATFDAILANVPDSHKMIENLTLSYENKCDWQKTDTSTDYYVNKDYYYAKKTVGTQTATYTYNYAPGDEKTETVTVCSRICEEAIMVEYGPPVASKAGLCFEYSVKVTSYVNCQSTTPENPPESDSPYCLPAALCYNPYVGWIRQAGPTEEFESCVQKCDGGEYSQACSLACYNKVYKTKTTSKTLSYENKLNAQQMSYSIDSCKSENEDGCYYWSGDEIKWDAGTHPYGRWYYEVGWDISDSRYTYDSNGIKRKIKSDGSLCTDDCHWVGCSKGSYLNKQTAAKDYQRNLEEYTAAIIACRAAATCSQKTATYTIAVKYDTKDDNGNITVNKVYYPYTSDSQLKTNPSEGSNEYDLIAKDTFTNGVGYKTDMSTIIDYDGCYKSVDNKRWYLTEWGFPGTYINNKTGDISFIEPSDLSGWYQEKKKFCLPLNTETVNPTWWEWYFYKDDDCVDPDDIEAELQGTPGTSNGYNIEAIVNDFGYFGWNFNISCFYATYKECVPAENACCAPTPDPDPDPDPTPDCEDCPEAENYVFRTVDLDNMFPNSGYDVADENKRNIGFNWTSKATLLSLKVGNTNSVNPEELIEQIQTKGESVYSEDPDYQFYLTPSDLTKLRSHNKNNSYTAWNGTISEVNGIKVYESNIFRGTGKLLSEDSILKISENLGVFNE